MWIVSVYLIEPAAPHKELTYFSAEKREPGEIVPIPARGRLSCGLVTKSEPARELRQTVRSSDFRLQKITGAGGKLLGRAFLHAAFETAAYSGASAGAVLSALVPAAVLGKLAGAPAAPAPEKAPARARSAELIVGPRAARLEHYRRFADEAAAQHSSLLIVAPTVAEAERIAQALSAIVFHGGMPKKKLLETWRMVAASGDRALVVGTPIALSLPALWGRIVLERALARGYERAARPFIDVRAAAERLAGALGAALAVGSPVLPIADALRTRAPKQSAREAAVSLIDMRLRKDAEHAVRLSARPKFELFSPHALGRLAETLARGENALLMTARRGLAPHTTCDDCGMPLSCPRCGSGLVLHEERQRTRYSLLEADAQRWFECHYCGYTERVRVLCPACGSWRLSMHGIGLTLVDREAERRFPLARRFSADETLASDAAKAMKIASQFARSRGALLAATEGMLAHLEAPVPLSVVVSADSMLYVPEYSAPERALAFLAELSGMTAGELIVQTRVPEHPALAALASGESGRMRDNELALREKFRYPPFWTLIRLSVSGSAGREKAQADAIMKALEPFSPTRFPGRTMRRSIAREHILVRLPRRAWVDQKLLAFIRSLPPSVEVRVNPKNIISD